MKKWSLREKFAACKKSFEQVAQPFLGKKTSKDHELMSKHPHYILWSIFIFLLLFFIWAFFSKIDEVTVIEGKVVPTSQTQVLQNLEGGIVKNILVKEGNIVEKGQVLMNLDASRFSHSYNEGNLQELALKAKEMRLWAEANNTPFNASATNDPIFSNMLIIEQRYYDTRKQDYQKKINILESELSQKQQELAELKAHVKQSEYDYDLMNKELLMTSPLVKEGAVAEVEYLRLERQVNDIAGDLNRTKLAIPRLESAIVEASNKIQELQLSNKNEIFDDLNQTNSKLVSLHEANLVLQDRLARTAIISPIKGIVKKISEHTIGGVVETGLDLIELVPYLDTLQIEAKVKPKNIAFIHPGLKAMVKVTAYEYSVYGGIPGVVKQISADTLSEANERQESYFLVTVVTEKNYLGPNEKKLLIIPGMTVTVDVMTGQKTILDYLLRPILKAQEALHEH